MNVWLVCHRHSKVALMVVVLARAMVTAKTEVVLVTMAMIVVVSVVAVSAVISMNEPDGIVSFAKNLAFASICNLVAVQVLESSSWALHQLVSLLMWCAFQIVEHRICTLSRCYECISLPPSLQETKIKVMRKFMESRYRKCHTLSVHSFSIFTFDVTYLDRCFDFLYDIRC